MTFDVAKHTLVPKQTKLGDKEREQLVASYNINIQQLPKILMSDAGITKLNAKGGDVIKIERSSRTAGNTVYYRVVVEQ
ncbi:MAG: DNA-directed RNA polymerase subunit H [Candidatus Woesearchaeota archaeon]